MSRPLSKVFFSATAASKPLTSSKRRPPRLVIHPQTRSVAQLSDQQVYFLIPAVARAWINYGAHIEDVENLKKMPPLSVKHLLMGLFRLGANGMSVSSEINFEEDHIMADGFSCATFAALQHIYKQGNPIDQSRWHSVWELYEHQAKRLQIDIETDVRSAQLAKAIRFTPAFRQLLNTFLVQRPHAYAGKDFLEFIFKSSQDEGLRTMNPELAIIHEKLTHVAQEYAKISGVTKPKIDKSQPPKEETKTIYQVRLDVWQKKLIEAQGHPAEHRAISDSQLVELQSRLKEYQDSMPKESSAITESFMNSDNTLQALFALPFVHTPERPNDPQKVAKALDQWHYGLKPAKNTILEYTSVVARRQKHGLPSKGHVVCFLGPPGTGKTSLAKAIAKATDRPFYKLALGGVAEEQMLRGDRSVYIGSHMGNVLKAFAKTNSTNPVIMLDEVDKLGSKKVEAALLEVLDPEQNPNFQDHFVGAYDISRALFICTANSVEDMPLALRDRMVFVELPGYSKDEKLKIAKDYMLPRLLKDRVLSDKQIQIQDAAIQKIIQHYTHEAGLRHLERRLEKIVDIVVRRIEAGTRPFRLPFIVTPKNLATYIGLRPPFYKVKPSQVGRVNALTASELGGSVMPLDVAVNKIRTRLEPKVVLTYTTGQIGPSEEESTHKALQYVRSHSQEISALLGERNDKAFKDDKHLVEVLMDSGGEDSCGPTDGPSAGVAQATGIISARLNRKVKGDVAMTGTLSLHGDVGAVGGVLNKLSAAVQAGVKTVLVPQANLTPDGKKLLLEGGGMIPIPKSLSRQLTIIPISHYRQAIAYLFEPRDA